MAFRYPYTNLHELNLDWILEEVKKVQDFDERVTRVENREILTDEELEAVKAAIAPTFSAGTAYAIGAYVWRNDNLYRFDSTHYAGAWDASQVTQVADTNELRFAIQSIAPRFNQEIENLPGSYVFYSNALYKLESGHAANQTWANTPKTYVQISTELEALHAADDDLADSIVALGTDVNDLKSEVNSLETPVYSELLTEGNATLSFLNDRTMSTSGFIYPSSGNTVCYIKVYEHMALNFFMQSGGDQVAAWCRYGFSDTVPADGTTVTGYSSGYGSIPATRTCYLVFTRPSASGYTATYISSESAASLVNKIDSDLYSSENNINCTMMPNTAINYTNGKYFAAAGWTAGYAQVKKGSVVSFYADDVLTNCRYTLFDGNLDYENIVSFDVNYSVWIPEDKDYILMCSCPGTITQFVFKQDYTGVKERAESFWHGKKIVWFGTSIPAGVVNAGDSNGNGAYPERLGYMIGAKVYNESVGSSRVRAGNYELASASDPLGYAGNGALGVLLSLSLSSTEKQNFIDDWVSTWDGVVPDPTNIMPNLTAAQIDEYKATSWDIKLSRYLSGGSVGQCDLYVFDHGFNDAVLPDMFDNFSDDPPSADPTNRGYWIGAMNYIFKKILDDNPKAKIIIIGHYMNAPTQGTTGQYLIKNGVDKCCAGQEKLAQLWGIPIIKTWEYMRISNNIINNNGTDMPVLFAYFPDGIHPASDTTGYALKYYADVLYPLIKDIN